MSDVSWETIGGLVFRRLLAAAAGFLFAHGILVADGAAGVTRDMFISGGLIIWSGLLSWWQKQGQAIALRDAQRAYDALATQYHAVMKKPPAPSAVTVTKP